VQRKKLTAIAVTTAAAVAIGVPVAMAIEVDQTITVKAPKKGTKAKPKNGPLNVDIVLNAKDRALNGTFGTTRAIIRLDKNMVFNNKRFPTCAESVILANESQCPARSKVATGRAEAKAGAGGAVSVNPTVTAYNGPNNKFILKLNKRAGDPVDSTGIIVGTLRRDSGKYGAQLNVPIPLKYQEQLGLKVTLTRFIVNIPATAFRGRSYVQSVGCPAGGRYAFAGDFTFTDNTKNSATFAPRC
jgi:hypothetical protein